MGKILFYYTLLSPPSRAVMLTGQALGIEFDWKNVDLMKGEHLSAEFKKLNPQHTIPLIDDDGVIIYDSHAICAYLVDKYAKTDNLYPKDLAKRAEVDARLHFDTGFLFARLRFLYEPIIYYGSSEVPTEKIQYIEKCWPLMEAFLERGPYLCGNELTIADFCCVATVSSLGHFGASTDKYPKLTGWLKRMADLPYYDKLCGEGADLLIKSVDQLIEKNRG